MSRGCSSTCKRWEPQTPPLVPKEQGLGRGQDPQGHRERWAQGLESLAVRGRRERPGNPTPQVIGIRCSLTCRIHREAGSIYLSGPAALSACGRRWQRRGWARRA